MITKPPQHDTDRAGRVVFVEMMQNLNFVANSVVDDYGIDYNVQAFDGLHPTGAWFHVQLKSSAAPSYASDRSFISFEMDLDHLVHFALQLHQPIFLVLVDTTQRRVFWHSPQLEAQRISEASNTGQESLTLRVPVSQELPGSAEVLMRTLKQLYLLLSSREIINSPLPRFHEVFATISNPEEAFAAFQEKADLVRLQRVAADFRQGRSHDAVRRAETVFADEDAAIEARFHAAIQLSSIEWSEDLRSGAVGPSLANATHRWAKRLRSLAKGSPPWVKLSAIFIGTIARLEALVYQDGADYMRLQQLVYVGASPLTIIGLQARRAASAKNILELYRRSYRLAVLASRMEESWVFVRVVTRLPTVIAPYLISLRISRLDNVEEIFVVNNLEILKWSFAVAEAIGDSEGAVLAIMGALTAAENPVSTSYTWARHATEELPPGRTKTEATEALRKVEARWRGEEEPGGYNPDPNWQIVQKLALSANLDISDENSILVRRLRIAARDFNPERFLRYCENLVITFGAISRVDRQIERLLSIDTSSNKVVHCRKFDLHVESTECETAFTQFENLHCSNCEHRVPRSSTWTYSGETRAQVDRENLEFSRLAIAQGKAMRFTDKDDLE